MNEKIAGTLIFYSLFCFAGFALAGITAPGVPQDFTTLLDNIITGVGTIMASLGGLMVVIAGFLFMTSAGNPGRLATAKTALFYAIIGIVIGGLASAIAAVIKTTIGS